MPSDVGMNNRPERYHIVAELGGGQKLEENRVELQFFMGESGCAIRVTPRSLVDRQGHCFVVFVVEEALGGLYPKRFQVHTTLFPAERTRILFSF